MLGFNGGLIGPERTTPNRSFTSGLYTVNESVIYRRDDNWPLLGADPNFLQSSLILHGEGINGSTVFQDTSQNYLTCTIGNSTRGTVQISTNNYKYGNSSIYVLGESQYYGAWLQTPSSSLFTFGTGSYTIECFIYLITYTASDRGIFRMERVTSGDNSGGDVKILNGSLRYQTDYANPAIQGSTVSSNTWHHIALCRSGTSTRLFLNGIQQGSTYTDTFNYPHLRLSFGISRHSSSTSYDAALQGYMDEIRVTKGVARYTSNFTPPSAQFIP